MLSFDSEIASLSIYIYMGNFGTYIQEEMFHIHFSIVYKNENLSTNRRVNKLGHSHITEYYIVK